MRLAQNRGLPELCQFNQEWRVKLSSLWRVRYKSVPFRKHCDVATSTEPDPDLFNFTRGRFVCNEKHEIAQRYVRFNVKELVRIAADSVGSRTCTNIKKCPDGSYNKALLLTMNDGAQVIAKIPNPNAGRPHFTTASEVATMEFVRQRLGTPVPPVYRWSSKADETDVGAEFIMMEKVPGVQLQTVWSTLDTRDRFKLTKQVARYQKAWMSCRFTKYGSLYFTQDLDVNARDALYIGSDGTPVFDSHFAIGPSTGRDSNDEQRSSVEFDRGPWNTLEEHLTAIGRREANCIETVACLPHSPISLFGPGTYQPTRAKKLRAIRYYLQLLKYLVPTDTHISLPCLWHNDLHSENIFVDPDCPTTITGIIDWQSTEIAPLSEHDIEPAFLGKHRSSSTASIVQPQLPSNFAQLEPAVQAKENALLLDRGLAALYRKLLHKFYPSVYEALLFKTTESFEMLTVPRKILVDGEALYMALILELEKTWDTLPGVRAHGAPPFPFHLSSEERSQIEDDKNSSLRAMEAMGLLQQALGDLAPEKGVVRHDEYDEFREAMRQLKPQIVDMYAKNEDEKVVWRETWPFDD